MKDLRSFLKNKRFIVGLYLAPTIAAFSIALVMLPGIRPQAIDSIANSTADVVIGQPDMNSNLINQVGYGKTLYYPSKPCISGTKLFIPDNFNNRVLIYNSILTANNAPADVIIGQPDFLSVSANQGGSPAANTLYGPTSVFCDGTKLFINEYSNNRVLIYNSIPTANNAPADVVIGQADFTSNSANQGGSPAANTLQTPEDVYSDGTKLYIADWGNNRVLIYNTIPTRNNALADVVIGQANMTSNLPNQGLSVGGNTMYGGRSVALAGTKLLIADYSNNRVLIFNSIPTSNNASADCVVGQTSKSDASGGCSAQKLYVPRSVCTDGNKMIIADTNNNRILIFNSIPVSDGASADIVIGQSTMSSNTENQGGAVGANTLNLPMGVFYNGTKLLISDDHNSRVLIFNSLPSTFDASADTVIGQPDMTSSSVNQTATWTKANSLYNPRGVYSDGTKLFVSDRYNNRVLIYNTIPTSNNASANVVIGQQNFTSNSANQGGSAEANTLCWPGGVYSDGTRLFVADSLNNRVLIYNTIPTSNNASADVVIGQQNFTSNSINQGSSSAEANTLYKPMGIYTDGTRLFVADWYNNRVLIYNTIPTSRNASADVVIGQQNFTSNSINQGGSSAGANTLNGPYAVYSDGTRLFVADFYNNRVLIYNTIPTSSNASADIVIGQQNMTSSSANQGGSAGANTLHSPSMIYGDSTKLFIGDTYNHRVLIYNTIPTSNNASANVVIGQQNSTSNSKNQGGSVGSNTLYQPNGLYSDGTRLFVVDVSNSRILIYNLTTTKPVISDVKFDGSGYVSGDTIRTAPVISAKMTDTGGVGGIYINNLKINVDTTLYTYASFDASTDNYNSTTGLVTFKVKNTLSTGTHNVKIEISDYLGNWGTYEANNLKVNESSGTVQLEGIPLNYPNPFRPLSETTKLTYKMTVDSDILIYIFDVRGVLIKKTAYSSGSMGGKAGYNEITWDGKDDFGSVVGNGIYPFRIVAGGRVLGRGKIAVLE